MRLKFLQLVVKSLSEKDWLCQLLEGQEGVDQSSLLRKGIPQSGNSHRKSFSHVFLPDIPMKAAGLREMPPLKVFIAKKANEFLATAEIWASDYKPKLLVAVEPNPIQVESLLPDLLFD